ncbi:c-type cytochrome [Sphingosinithalassobacter portus]|uniref:c-type cytochrome n=1 Tax=Stakelama portus TaxID=2676234 RepID=UPI000D6DD2E2|nr:c-type cytochrome [Sphingosinithalassobacter portus]
MTFSLSPIHLPLLGAAGLLLAACGSASQTSETAPSNAVEGGPVATDVVAPEASSANSAMVENSVIAATATPVASPSATATPVQATPTPSASPTLAATAAPTPVPADPPASFAMCKACHTTAHGGAASVGPNLFGIVGAQAGARTGYSYSDAMKNAGFRWTRANLDAFLANPAGKVPGTRMMLPGMSDAAQRAAIIDYLTTLK